MDHLILFHNTNVRNLKSIDLTRAIYLKSLFGIIYFEFNINDGNSTILNLNYITTHDNLQLLLKIKPRRKISPQSKYIVSF